jgi:hypothetical protein
MATFGLDRQPMIGGKARNRRALAPLPTSYSPRRRQPWQRE